MSVWNLEGPFEVVVFHRGYFRDSLCVARRETVDEIGPFLAENAIRAIPVDSLRFDTEPYTSYVLVRDGFGLVIPVWRLQEIIRENRPRLSLREERQLAYLGRYGWTPEDYRRGPVPKTGKRGRYGWLRDIRTMGDHRANSALKADSRVYEGLPRPRPSRSGYNLPTAWDDIPRHAERCWKRHRRKQYRRKPC